MACLTRSVKSFVTVVIFLVLAALAAILYGGNQAQQQKMEQNAFWQQSRQAAATLWSAATGVANASANPSPTFLQTWRNKIFGSSFNTQMANEDISVAAASAKAGAVRNLWNQFTAKITGRGQAIDINGQEININNAAATVNGGLAVVGTMPTSSVSDFLTWEKNDNGAAIILKWKNGREYRLPLPFKFLSR